MANPFTLTFGKKPIEYITRHESIDEVVHAFTESPARYQTYLIRGVRGSGKTVLMTAIEQEIERKEDWLCVDLNPVQNLVEDFSYRLADVCREPKDISERGIDISAAGFGIGIGGQTDRDYVSRAEIFLKRLCKKRKKLLITIDEVENTLFMKQFISQFQIWIRKEFPIFLLMTGLYENIDSVQNSPQLTFLLRSPKVTTGPLSISQIARQYEITLEQNEKTALTMARLTKGYAFAFQALGMLCWEHGKTLEEKLIIKELDDLLDEYVYRKIWNGLSMQDKTILQNMPEAVPIKVSELCKAANVTPQVFSKYRERLINRGIIASAGHGYVEYALPRFGEICKFYI